MTASAHEDDRNTRELDSQNTTPTKTMSEHDDSAGDLEEHELPAGSMLGNYRILHKIAMGGFATVYAAEEVDHGHEVAIKVMHTTESQSPEDVRRFMQEVRAIAAINHHNIVKVHRLARLEDGRYYYVMELLNGPTLSQIIAERRRLPPADVVTLLEPVAEALSAAHAIKCIHRDIKASNIGTTISNGRRIVKLLDFGVAKLLGTTAKDAPQTRLHARVGTLSSMAPEQIIGSAVGPATDIYALGILIYRMLTGRYPFYSRNPIALESMHLTTPAPSPGNLVPVPPALDAVVQRCLEKNPEARYQSVAELIQELRAAAGQPASTSESVCSAMAIYVSLQTRAGVSPDDDVLQDELETLSDDHEKTLRGAGFQIALNTGTSMLAIAPRPVEPALQRQQEKDTRTLAEDLYQRTRERSTSHLECSIVIHLDEAKVQGAAGEPLIVGGAIMRVGSWLPAAIAEGVHFTRNAADGRNKSAR